MIFERGFDDYLLEIEGVEMNLLEAICKARGISYEEFTREAIDLFLERGPQEDEDNEGEEWKS